MASTLQDKSIIIFSNAPGSWAYFINKLMTLSESSLWCMKDLFSPSFGRGCTVSPGRLTVPLWMAFKCLSEEWEISSIPQTSIYGNQISLSDQRTTHISFTYKLQNNQKERDLLFKSLFIYLRWDRAHFACMCDANNKLSVLCHFKEN